MKYPRAITSPWPKIETLKCHKCSQRNTALFYEAPRIDNYSVWVKTASVSAA